MATISASITQNSTHTATIISGQTTEVPENHIVNISFTDSNEQTILATTNIKADGSFMLEVDTSSLADGDILTNISVLDHSFVPQFVNPPIQYEKNAAESNINSEVIFDETGLVDITGTTKNINKGEIVSITISDSENKSFIVTTTVNTDGTYQIDDINVSELADGELTFTTVVTNPRGGTESDVDKLDKSTVIDDPTVDSIVTIDDTNAQVDITGKTENVTGGTDTQITITDKNGNEVIVTATVDSNGNYEINDIDVSNLTDGELTVITTVVGTNGNQATDIDIVIKDAVASELNTEVDIDNDNKQLDITGTSRDIPVGSQVEITISDKEGNIVKTTTTVDNNGDYIINDIDISTLTDGELTVDSKAIDNNGNTVTDVDVVLKESIVVPEPDEPEDEAIDRYSTFISLNNVAVTDTKTAKYTGPNGYHRPSYKYDTTYDPNKGYMTDDNNDHIDVIYHVGYGSRINTYDGDDVVRVGTHISRSAINLGEGDNTLSVGFNHCAPYSGYVQNSTITAGSGDDQVSIRVGMSGSCVNLGDGDNQIDVGCYVSCSTIYTGSGDDVINIQGSLTNRSYLSTGEGDDAINIGGHVSCSTIHTGAGDDVVNIQGSLANRSLISTGEGDDIISIGSLDSGAIVNGGAGFDTLNITSHDCNVSLSQIFNIEHINLGQGTQYLTNVNIKTIKATNANGIFIEGDSCDAVSLGTCNRWGNTSDSSDGRYASWKATDSVEKGGETYTEYTYTADTSYKIYIDTDVAIY